MLRFVVEASVGPGTSPVIRLERRRAPDKLGGDRDRGQDCGVGEVPFFNLMLRCASDGDVCPTHKGLHHGQDRIFGSFPYPRLGADRMTEGLMLLDAVD